MDTQIMNWLCQRPQDWWANDKSDVYTWGKGSWDQLGHTSSERGLPAIVDSWKDVQQVIIKLLIKYSSIFHSVYTYA